MPFTQMSGRLLVVSLVVIVAIAAGAMNRAHKNPQAPQTIEVPRD